MQVNAIHTEKVVGKQCLCEFLDKHLENLEENSILAITSKIVSICENRVFSKSLISKEDLIKQEADVIINGLDNPYGICLTIKNNILIPSAGVDESNSNECYIAYPTNVFKSAEEVWLFFTKKYNISNFGVLITDSHTTPLRRGVTGIALGWCGFEPIYSYIGKKDIFGKTIKVTNVNIPDALAAATVFEMGEGNEQTPIAIIQNAKRVTFCQTSNIQEEYQKLSIPIQEDIYYPLLKDCCKRA